MSDERDFLHDIGTGTRRVEREAEARLDPETAEALRKRLAEFDAASTRAAVEARSAWLGEGR